MGSYEELGNDVLLLASMRSVDEKVKLKPATEIPKGKLNALRVIQRQDFIGTIFRISKTPKWLGKAMTDC